MSAAVVRVEPSAWCPYCEGSGVRWTLRAALMLSVVRCVCLPRRPLRVTSANARGLRLPRQSVGLFEALPADAAGVAVAVEAFPPDGELERVILAGVRLVIDGPEGSFELGDLGFSSGAVFFPSPGPWRVGVELEAVEVEAMSGATFAGVTMDLVGAVIRAEGGPVDGSS